jgi:predicted dehydrogenase
MTTPRISRRTFAGAAASAFAFTYVPKRVFGANDRLQVACIGVGGQGGGDVRDVAASGCDVVALCDVDQQRGAESFDRFTKAKRYADFRVMLDKQRDIDAVTVSTPDHTHAVAAVAAMKAGKHVYCQKPLAHSVYEARTMAEVAREQKVATQMGNQAHAGEAIRGMVEAVRAGIIGPVTEVHTWTDRPIWPQGMKHRPPKAPVPATLDWHLWLGPAASREYGAGYLPFDWRGWWDFGTGALGDMACHIMDMPYWALELGAPTAIEAQSEGATAEAAPWWSTVTYEFPARGTQPPVKFLWYDGYRGPERDKAPPNRPSAEILEGQDPGRWDGILIGQRGKLFFNRGRTQWLVTPEETAHAFQRPPQSLPRVENEDLEWVAACKGGSPALSSFEYSGPFSEMVLLGNVAIRLGRKVQWDAQALRCPDAPEADQYLRPQFRSGWTL